MQQKCQRGCLLWRLCSTAFGRHRWAGLLLPSVVWNSVLLQQQRPQMQTRPQHGLPSRVAAASAVAAVRVLPFLVRPVGPSAHGLLAVASATSPMGVPMEGPARSVSGTGDTYQLYRYLMPEVPVSGGWGSKIFSAPTQYPSRTRKKLASPPAA